MPKIKIRLGARVTHTLVCAAQAVGSLAPCFPYKTCAFGAHTEVWATHRVALWLVLKIYFGQE